MKKVLLQCINKSSVQPFSNLSSFKQKQQRNTKTTSSNFLGFHQLAVKLINRCRNLD